MRFKLVFHVKKDQVFPFNYQYELSAGLFKIFNYIKESVPKYKILDNQDFLNHITFSRIEIPKRTIQKDGIKSLSKLVFLKLSIGFPDIQSGIIWKAFAHYNNCLYIFKKFNNRPPVKIKMFLKDIEFLPAPDFKDEMKFKMLSPMVLTKNDQSKYHYISFEEQELLKQKMKVNLIEKFEELYSHSIDVNFFDIEFDKEYCSKREKKDLHSLIRMKEGEKSSFSVLGLLVPFVIKAPSELIQVGYYSGFGEKTSLGFGMTEVSS